MSDIPITPSSADASTNTNKVLQGLGIPYAALLSIIFGMMFLSFPVGAFVVFNSDIGGDITYEYPVEYVYVVFEGLLSYVPISVGVGDVFIVVWITFVILFGIGMLGQKDNFIKTLSPILGTGKDASSNYLVSMLKWFTILVFLSIVVDVVQNYLFGISITPPDFGNDLIQFFSASTAPILEELVFRVLLIGLPLYALFYHRLSVQELVKSLWHPHSYLDVSSQSRVFVLIALVGVLFGMTHVYVGESWSFGKLTQATLGGFILGWVYYRHGLLAAILLHWATNYFVLSYLYFLAFINGVSVEDELRSNSLLGTFELLFFVAGAVSLAFVAANYFAARSNAHQSVRYDNDTSDNTHGSDTDDTIIQDDITVLKTDVNLDTNTHEDNDTSTRLDTTRV